MRLPLLWLALFTLLACPAAARDACGFTQNQPRFYQGRTGITALNVDPQGALFLNDALLRTLTRQLGLAECQVLLTQGEECEAALAAAPCPDPSWVCGGDMVIANSVYQAARSGLCAGGSTEAVCQTLADYPDIAAAVAAGECEAMCFAQLAAGNDTASGGDAPGAKLGPPPPPPGPPKAPASACYAFTLQVDSSTQKEAQTVAANVHNASTMGVLLDTLASYSAPGKRIAFVMGDTGDSKGHAHCTAAPAQDTPDILAWRGPSAAGCRPAGPESPLNSLHGCLCCLPHLPFNSPRAPCRPQPHRRLWLLPAAQPAAVPSSTLPTATALPATAPRVLPAHRQRLRQQPQL